MRSQGYYRLPGSEMVNNCADNSRYLLVNCAGICSLEEDFLTNIPHGRRDWYLQYVHQGTLVTRLQGVECTASPGSFLIYPAEIPQYYFRGSQATLEYYWIHFTGSEAAPLLRRMGLPTETVIHAPKAEERLRGLFSKIFEEFLHRDNCMEDVTVSLLLQILTVLSRHSNESRGWQPREKVLRSLKALHQGFSSPISVADLAKMENLSISRYRTVFHQVTGMSPSEYLTALRMQHAEELLLTSDLPIGRIAEECGYSDALYFSRTFRQKKGLSPTEYRDAEA